MSQQGPEKRQITHNVRFIGDAGTGMEDFLERYASGTYNDTAYILAARPDTALKKVEDEELVINTDLKRNDSRFRNDTPDEYYREADIVMVCFDVTDPKSFENAQKIWLAMKDNFQKDDVKFVLVGLKADSVNPPRQVTTKDAFELAESLGIEYIECSARLNQAKVIKNESDTYRDGGTISEVFDDVVKRDVKEKGIEQKVESKKSAAPVSSSMPDKVVKPSFMQTLRTNIEDKQQDIRRKREQAQHRRQRAKDDKKVERDKKRQQEEKQKARSKPPPTPPTVVITTPPPQVQKTVATKENREAAMKVAIELKNKNMELYLKIQNSELKGKKWNEDSTKSECPNLMAAIRVADELTTKIRNDITKAENPGAMYSHYVNVLEAAMQLHDYQTAAAILSGLDLQLRRQNIPEDKKQALREIANQHKEAIDKYQNMLSPVSNYKELRSLIANNQDGIAPLNFMMADLYTYETLLKYDGEGKVLNPEVQAQRDEVIKRFSNNQGEYAKALGQAPPLETPVVQPLEPVPVAEQKDQAPPQETPVVQPLEPEPVSVSEEKNQASPLEKQVVQITKSKPTLVAQIMTGFRDPQDGGAQYSRDDFKYLGAALFASMTPKEFFNQLTTAYKEIQSNEEKVAFLHNAELLIHDIVMADVDQEHQLELVSGMVRFQKEAIAKDPNDKPLFTDIAARFGKLIEDAQKRKEAVDKFQEKASRSPTAEAKDYLSDPIALAEDMKLRQLQNLSQMRLSSYLNKDWESHKDDPSHPVTAFTNDFNNINAMVITDILKAGSKEEQKKIYAYYVKVLEHSIKIGDYTSGLAIISALNNTAVARLEYILDELPPHVRRTVSNIKDLFKDTKNYEAYKKDYEKKLRNNETVVPYLARLNNEITMIEDGNTRKKVYGEQEKLNDNRVMLEGRQLLSYITDQQMKISTQRISQRTNFGDRLSREPVLTASEREKKWDAASSKIKARGVELINDNPVFSPDLLDQLQARKTDEIQRQQIVTPQVVEESKETKQQIPPEQDQMPVGEPPPITVAPPLGEERQRVPLDKGKEELGGQPQVPNVEQVSKTPPLKVDPIEQLMRGSFWKQEDGKDVLVKLDDEKFKALARSLHNIKTPQEILSKLAELSKQPMTDDQKFTFLDNARKLMKELIGDDLNQTVFKELNSYILANDEAKKELLKADKQGIIANYLEIMKIDGNSKVIEARAKLETEVTQAARAISAYNPQLAASLLESKAEPKIDINHYLQVDLMSIFPRNMDKMAQAFAQDLMKSNLAMLTQVKSEEFANLNFTKPFEQSKSPNLMQVIRRYDQIANMARDDILLAKNTTQQKNIFNFYINVAQIALKNGDYQTASALLGAFSCAPIERLTYLTEDKKAKAVIDELTAALAPSKLNSVQTTTKDTIVPFTGPYANQLTMTMENKPREIQLEDKSKQDNFDRLVIFGSLVQNLQVHQTRAFEYLAAHSEPLQTSVLGHLKEQKLDEDIAYDRSQEIYSDKKSYPKKDTRKPEDVANESIKRIIENANNAIKSIDRLNTNIEVKRSKNPEEVVKSSEEYYKDLSKILVQCQQIAKEHPELMQELPINKITEAMETARGIYEDTKKAMKIPKPITEQEPSPPKVTTTVTTSPPVVAPVISTEITQGMQEVKSDSEVQQPPKVSTPHDEGLTESYSETQEKIIKAYYYVVERLDLTAMYGWRQDKKSARNASIDFQNLYRSTRPETVQQLIDIIEKVGQKNGITFNIDALNEHLEKSEEKIVLTDATKVTEPQITPPSPVTPTTETTVTTPEVEIPYEIRDILTRLASIAELPYDEKHVLEVRKLSKDLEDTMYNLKDTAQGNVQPIIEAVNEIYHAIEIKFPKPPQVVAGDDKGKEEFSAPVLTQQETANTDELVPVTEPEPTPTLQEEITPEKNLKQKMQTQPVTTLGEQQTPQKKLNISDTLRDFRTKLPLVVKAENTLKLLGFKGDFINDLRNKGFTKDTFKEINKRDAHITALNLTASSDIQDILVKKLPREEANLDKITALLKSSECRNIYKSSFEAEIKIREEIITALKNARLAAKGPLPLKLRRKIKEAIKLEKDNITRVRKNLANLDSYIDEKASKLAKDEAFLENLKSKPEEIKVVESTQSTPPVKPAFVTKLVELFTDPNDKTKVRTSGDMLIIAGKNEAEIKILKDICAALKAENIGFDFRNNNIYLHPHEMAKVNDKPELIEKLNKICEQFSVQKSIQKSTESEIPQFIESVKTKLSELAEQLNSKGEYTKALEAKNIGIDLLSVKNENDLMNVINTLKDSQHDEIKLLGNDLYTQWHANANNVAALAFDAFSKYAINDSTIMLPFFPDTIKTREEVTQALNDILARNDLPEEVSKEIKEQAIELLTKLNPGLPQEQKKVEVPPVQPVVEQRPTPPPLPPKKPSVIERVQSKTDAELAQERIAQINELRKINIKQQQKEVQQALDKAFPRLPDEQRLKMDLSAPPIPLKPTGRSSAPRVGINIENDLLRIVFRKQENYNAFAAALDKLNIPHTDDKRFDPPGIKISAQDLLAIKDLSNTLYNQFMTEKAHLSDLPPPPMQEMHTEPKTIHVEPALTERTRIPLPPVNQESENPLSLGQSLLFKSSSSTVGKSQTYEGSHKLDKVPKQVDDSQNALLLSDKAKSHQGAKVGPDVSKSQGVDERETKTVTLKK
ncbi:MAG: hypothetical protein JSR17_02485 [Proteobacteria bacterium]|nr:hypothetical protein [Pseudomonadota bacterium]